MPAFGVSLGPALRLRRPPALHRRRFHLDHRDCFELPVSVLLVRDGDRRVGVVADQGSVFCHEVVYGADSLLKLVDALRISISVFMLINLLFLSLPYFLRLILVSWVEIINNVFSSENRYLPFPVLGIYSNMLYCSRCTCVFVH